MGPKVAGAWNLHSLTLQDELDLFLMLGSVTWMLGPPGQAAYAGANAFLAALAEQRRASGLPALAVDLGAVSGVGHVAGRPAVDQRLGDAGLRTVTPATAWGEVDEALRRGDARLTLADVDWDSWSRGPGAGAPDPVPPSANGGPAAAEAGAGSGDRVAAIVARVLEAPAGRLDRRRPLTDLGLDSLMAVEVTTAIERELGVAVSLADVLEGLSIGALADVVAARGPVPR
jgi:acyl carrier protein